VEVFEGNTSDPKTVGSQIEKVAQRFRCERVTFVGDRGMLKSDPLEALVSEGFSYITGITKPQIETLLREGHLQLGLFDNDLKEIRVGDVRYVYRRNPVRREETEAMRESRRRSVEVTAKRQNDYLAGHPKALPEVALKKIRDKMERLKIASWLSVELDGRSLKLLVDEKALAEEALLDGCYVLKTDLPESVADKETVNARYKSLSEVERAFRSCKTLLELRPIHVRTKESTRGHAFVVMLAYMIRQALERAWKALDLTVEEGLSHLKTLCVMRMELPGGEEIRFVPRPSDMCAKLLDALGVKLPETVSRSTTNVRTYKKLSK
jgi:transposase